MPPIERPQKIICIGLNYSDHAEEQGVNLPPSEGLQFFGLVNIDGDTEVMTVRLMDRDDTELFRQDLQPTHPG